MKSSKGVFLCVPIPFGNTTLKMYTLLDRQVGGPRQVPALLSKISTEKQLLWSIISVQKNAEKFCEEKSLLVVRLVVFGCFIQAQPYGCEIVFCDV